MISIASYEVAQHDAATCAGSPYHTLFDAGERLG